jgi:hypothetical protein
MGLYEAVARWRHGELLGGETGRAERSEAEAWMQEQAVHSPERFVSMLAPGLDG